MQLIRFRTVAMALIFLCLTPVTAFGQRAKMTPERLEQILTAEQSESGYTVGRWAYRRLTEAKRALADGNYAETKAHVDEMTERLSDLNDHEKALMYQTYGLMYAGMGDHVKAAESFEDCLSMAALPAGGALQTEYHLAQMYLSVEKFRLAAVALSDWFTKADNPAPQAHYLMAATYAQLKEFSLGLQHIKRAMAKLKKAPPEAWLQLQLSLHFELNQLPQVASVLKTLIERYSRKAYWLQLSAVYSELGETTKAAAVLDLANKQGLLSEHDELMNLARWYSSEGAPTMAADLLEKALASGSVERKLESVRLLAASLMNAREYDRAIEPLAEAGELSKDGNFYLQLGHLHVERQEWKPAVKAIQSAIDKGGLSSPAHAYLFLGIAQNGAGNKIGARKAFREALKDNSTKAAAQQWLAQITTHP